MPYYVEHVVETSPPHREFVVITNYHPEKSKGLMAHGLLAAKEGVSITNHGSFDHFDDAEEFVRKTWRVRLVDYLPPYFETRYYEYRVLKPKKAI